MRYEQIREALFLRRPNRFIAQVLLDGQEVVCHVKNTGRCRELLLPCAAVYIQHCPGPQRKTAWDLIAVRKGEKLINMDAAAPNAVFGEWLRAGGLGAVPELVRPEQVHGDSRFDFYFETQGTRCFAEVKGVTLEEDGILRFPDAPTERGTRHLRELTRAAGEGYRCAAAFVIQMDGVTEVRPNLTTDPEFTAAFREAQAAGVRILMLPCHIEPDSVEIRPEYRTDWQDHL